MPDRERQRVPGHRSDDWFNNNTWHLYWAESNSTGSKHFTIQNKNGHQNQYMKHAHTRRSNANSKAQANMHTPRNNQCNQDIQCSNTWIWGFELSGCQVVQFCSWALFWMAVCSWIAWWAATTAAWRARWTCGRPCTQPWLTWYPAWSSSRMASSTWRLAWPGWTPCCRNCLISVNLQPSSRAIKFLFVFFIRMLFVNCV